MAAIEGAVRIKRTGKWIASIGIVIAITGAIATIVMSFLSYVPDSARHFTIFLVVFLGFFPAFFGGITWTTGWIVEGFAQRASSPVEKF